MEKSWEQKLKEAKQREAEEERLHKEEEAAKLAGTPHIVNLNEDPMLDRKVIYDIKGDGLSCGRRNKASKHKLQLGGTGIEPDHANFLTLPDGHVKLQPLSEKAVPNIKVNGFKLQDMQGRILKPNDRICIGPSAYFLFKNTQKEAEASMPDTDADPILFDFAEKEAQQNDNKAEMDIANALRQQQLAENEKNMAALKEQMQSELDAHAKLLAEKEQELKAAKAAGQANVEQLQNEVNKEKKEQ